jgi:Zn-dependent M16 (insulinase) family peptidase
MKLEVNKDYHGFHLKEERRLEEINSTGRLFYHTKSGARLVHIENDDDNKVFSITFRTPPPDSTGVPHILEHSVLCGSRKFPSKEPFVELAKGSLNTFLNAMTFPDKTMYPVASKNDKDLFHLMDVYLDAVFYPNIYKFPEILMQEGWHYELNSKDAPLSYVGVVYNEMKGVFSSPESILFRKIPESLFPHTPYGLESGGDPDVIVKLTQEQFLDFHKKYYHPSNSYIFLYGNGNVVEQLKFINEEYLIDFDKSDSNSQIPLQSPFSQRQEIIINYPLSPDDSEENKTFLSFNVVVGKATEPELYFAFDILEHMLLETPGAPLKKALIDAKIGKDVFGEFDSSLLQPTFSVIVKNSEEALKDKFLDITFKTLNYLAQKEIDKKLIEAAINRKEFKLREADYRGYPKGLYYAIQCMDSWLYDTDPFIHLEYEPVLKKIKKALTSNYFEELIKKYLINSSHSSVVMVKPEKGLEEKRAAKLQQALDGYKAGLEDDQVAALVIKTEELRRRQAEPDSPETLAKIPLLTLKDITPETEKLPCIETEEEGITVLSHPQFTSHIAYMNLYFDTTGVSQDLIPYIALLARVMRKVDTDKYNYADLANEIDIHTGGIDFSAEAFSDMTDDSIYFPKMVVKSRALAGKLPKLVELVSEVLSHSQFNDEHRLREIIQEAKSRIEMNIFQHGHAIASSRIFSYFSPVGKYGELLKGLSLYHFINDLEKNFEQKVPLIRENLKNTALQIFNRHNLLVSITTAEEDYVHFQKIFPHLLDHLGSEKEDKLTYHFELKPDNEGLLTPGKVQYVAKGYNYRQLGYHYSGILQVMRTIARLDYLWNRVRVQGGAYGGFANIFRNGNIFFGSYRDPHLKQTLNVFDEAENYLRDFVTSPREMTKYIIGTISTLDAPLTPSMKGERATAYYISSITQEDLQRERDEVLRTQLTDIRNCAELIADTMKQNCFCVLGSETKIRENEALFKKLTPVFS